MSVVVVVGGSQLQFPLVEAALREAKDVVCIDGDENCYCAKLADVTFVNCDISDPTSCIVELKNFDIENAVTAQSDVGVILVEQLKKIINRSDENLLAAEVFTYKDKFKDYLREHDLSAAEFLNASINDDLTETIKRFSCLNFPIAVKPSDSSGSRGVSKVSNIHQLRKAILKAFQFSRRGVILAENWFIGDEFGAQAFVDHRGHCVYLHHKDHMYNHIPVAHSETSKNHRLEEKIQTIVTDLSIKNAILNIDAVQFKNDVEIIEIGLRLGATDIFKMVNEKFNVNIFVNIIRSDYKLNDFQSASKLYGILFNPTKKKFMKTDSINSFELATSQGNITISVPSHIVEIPHLDDGTKRFGSFELEAFSGEVNCANLMCEIIQFLKKQRLLEEVPC